MNKLKQVKMYLEYKRLCWESVWFNEATPISAEKLIELFQTLDKSNCNDYYLTQNSTLKRMKKVVFEVEQISYNYNAYTDTNIRQYNIACRYSLTSFDDYSAIQEYLRDKWQKEQAQLILKEECEKRAKRVKFEEYLEELKQESKANG